MKQVHEFKDSEGKGEEENKGERGNLPDLLVLQSRQLFLHQLKVFWLWGALEVALEDPSRGGGGG